MASDEDLVRRLHGLQGLLLQDEPPSDDRRLTIESGVVEQLVEWLRRGRRTGDREVPLGHVAATLGLVLLYDPSQACHVAHAVLALVTLLDDTSTSCQRVALATLLTLFRIDPATQSTAIDAGILVRLNKLVVSLATSVQRLAMVAIRTLARTHRTSLSETDRATAVSWLRVIVRDYHGPDDAYATTTMAVLHGDNLDDDDDDEIELAALFHMDGERQKKDSRFDDFLLCSLRHFVTRRQVGTSLVTIARSLVCSLSKDDAWRELLELEDLRELTSGHDASVNTAAVQSGVVSLCVDRLHSDVRSTRKNAAGVLAQLAVFDPTLVRAIVEAISVDSLVELLDRGNRSATLVLLHVLVHDADSRVAAVAAGMVPCLVSAIRDGCYYERHDALSTLCLLVENDEDARLQDAKLEALNARAMAVLMAYFPHARELSRCVVLATIYYLVNGRQHAAEEFLATGGVNLLNDALTTGRPDEVSNAVRVVVRLFETHWLAEANLMEAGVVDQLIRLLHSENPEIRSTTAWALGSMAASHPFTKQALAQHPALPGMLHLVLGLFF